MSVALFNLIIGPKAQGKKPENAGMIGKQASPAMSQMAVVNNLSGLTSAVVPAIILPKYNRPIVISLMIQG